MHAIVSSRILAVSLAVALIPCGWVGAQPFDCDGVQPVAGTDITLERVAASLTRPVDVQAPPGDTDRIFIVEQLGRIRVLQLANGAMSTFLDIRSRVHDSGNEQGLLGLAFHPDYAENGYLYVNYTRTGTSSQRGDTRISRFTARSNSPDQANASSESVLLEFNQPFSNHNGGQIAFGPDGYLYIGTGDGGSGGDPEDNGQRMTTYLGKLLRIDVDSDGAPFAIPPDNPYRTSDSIATPRNAYWSIGLRNPWRFSFDAETGDLYIGDVGQNRIEEIDFAPASSPGGENWGWRLKEGTENYNNRGLVGPGAPVPPIYEYPHGGAVPNGCSVTGGIVYRGCRMPDLHGTYFVAEYCTHWIRSFRV